MILILSADAVAAALLGALIETLGYSVRFAQLPDDAEHAFRRQRPKVCLIDSQDPAFCTDEMFGRVLMRGMSVVIFGTSAALDHVRAFAQKHEIDTMLVPGDLPDVAAVLERALKKAG